jgi:hypothetical protein
MKLIRHVCTLQTCLETQSTIRKVLVPFKCWYSLLKKQLHGMDIQQPFSDNRYYLVTRYIHYGTDKTIILQQSDHTLNMNWSDTVHICILLKQSHNRNSLSTGGCCRNISVLFGCMCPESIWSKVKFDTDERLKLYTHYFMTVLRDYNYKPTILKTHMSVFLIP